VKLKPPSRISASDYQRVIALWQAAGLHIRPSGRDSEEAFARQCESGLQTGIGIENEAGELVGVTLATHDGRKGWINRLAVHPEYRRQGVAAALIEAAEEALRAQGMDVIAALIEQDNIASLSLFEKNGYIEHVGLHYVSKRSSDEA
jgi:ribosomal protein S18 acetylase RimI-like enzyme